MGDVELRFTLSGLLLPLSKMEQNLKRRFAGFGSSSTQGFELRLSTVGSLYSVVMMIGAVVSGVLAPGFACVLLHDDAMPDPQTRKPRPRCWGFDVNSKVRAPNGRVK